MSKLIREFDAGVQGAALLGGKASEGLLFTSGHKVLLQDLAEGTIRTLGDGYDLPSSIIATPDGQSLLVVDLDPAEGHFVLYAASLSDAHRRHAHALLRARGRPTQLAVHGTTLFYADRSTGRLSAVDLAALRERSLADTPRSSKAREKSEALAGHPRTLFEGLVSPVGLLVAPDGRRVYVSESKPGRIVSIGLDDGSRTVERLGLAEPQYLTLGTRKHAVLVPLYRGAGSVQSWEPATDKVETLVEMSQADRPFAAWEIGRNLVAVDRHRIHWWDLRTPVSRPVTLDIGNATPFIGSYERITADLGTSGLTFADLDFRLPDGEAAGFVSYARDDESAPNEVMLLVGYQPGMHKLEAVDRSTNTVVQTLEYEITDVWTDGDRSPAHWNVGELSHFTTGYTWGGGPAMPQNINVIPQSGTRNVCILMVDVSDSRYTTGTVFDTLRQHWSDGAVGPAPSARTYYEEVSHNTFTLARLGGTPVPYISLSSSWSDNFSTMPMPWPSNSFAPTNNISFAQACISAAAALTDGSGNPLVDFRQVQSLILVVRSAGTASTDNFFWPQAWGGSFTVPGGSATMNVLGMPDDWDTVRDSRTIPETLSHELGHNLGYPDLYTNANTLYSADVQARDITNFDLMSTEQQLPDMSIAQKMETGWVQSAWVMPFDFSRSTIPLDQTVTLHAAELGAPPAGRFSTVEVRIADGWNYYFEYRNTQAGQIGDQQLAGNPGDTANGAVLGTDVLSQSFTFPIARPQIMRLRRDAEGENSFFMAGEDYKETDTSSMAIADFRMSVVSTAADSAQVRIQYGTNGRPDLYIRPWPGGDNWQSPDIEVRNARSLADPANWGNVPWIGHANDVIARFRNRGPVTCRNVRVDFWVKDYTVSGGPEAWIGSATHDVPPESTTPFVEFTANWVPPDDGHKCIIVRTPLYIDASVNPNIVEITDSNNSAQSNYSRYIAASASPAKRGIAEVTLHNPFDKRAEIYVMPQIRGPFSFLYRLYMEHSSLKLDPGESRRVQIMVESMYGDPRLAALWERLGPKFFYERTRISLVGYGIPPETPEHPTLLGGAQIDVSSALATRFESFGGEGKDGFVRGRVVVARNGAPAQGIVLITLHGPDEGIDNTIRTPLDAQGYFALRGIGELIAKLKAKRITAHYPGRPGYSPSDAPNDLKI
jgi:M6 family metalloprotease-like protein